MSAQELSSTKRWLALVAVGIFVFMSTLDSTIVNIALPTIATSLKVSMSVATWSVAIYLIALSGMLLFFGRLGDLIGKVKVFRIGTIIFTVGSLLAGINLGIGFLLTARVVQALGSAMTMSNSFGIATELFPPQMRARAMAAIGIFVSLGSITGPGLGGLILQFSQWNNIFWVNVPVGILAIILGAVLLPREEKVKLDKKKLDWMGTILFFLTIALFFLAVELGQTIGFTSIPILAAMAVSIVLFVFFIRQERKCNAPMIQLGIFRNRLFSISLLASTLTFATYYFALIILPFYLQDLLKISTGQAGLVLMAYPLVMMVVGPFGGYLGDKYNKEIVSCIGIVLVVVTQFGFLRVSNTSSVWFVVVCLAINGAGNALFQSPNNALVMGSVEPKYLGVAGSINALARNIGMIIGITLATTTLFLTMSLKYGQNVTDYIPNRPDIFLAGMHVAFIISGVIGIIALVVVGSRLVGRYRRS